MSNSWSRVSVTGWHSQSRERFAPESGAVRSMRWQTSLSRSGLRGDRLAGALGLLLVLCLVALGVTPTIYADGPPSIPHAFYGTVTYDGAPVAENTLVEAFLGDVKKAQTTVDAEGRYALLVPGTTPVEVRFKVGGVPANESSTWQSGKVEELHLTVDYQPASPAPHRGGAVYPLWTVLLAGLVAGASLLVLRRRHRGQGSA